MDFAIRAAGPADAGPLADLAAQLGYPLPAAALLANLEHLQDQPTHRVLVAAAGPRLLGWLHVHEHWSLESGARAEISGLVVDAALRGHGVGARLVAEAEGWARARGLTAMRVRSRVEREAAHRFYRRLGYRQAKVQAVFDKPLPGPP